MCAVFMRYQWIVGSQFTSESVPGPRVGVDFFLHTVISLIIYLSSSANEKPEINDGIMQYMICITHKMRTQNWTSLNTENE